MQFNIGRKTVGGNAPVFIIAELSANHLGRLDVAIKTIKAMKASGADAVKIQTCRPETLTVNSSKKYFRIKHGTLWDGTTLYKLYKQTYTPWEWQPKLKKYAESLGLVFFSSPFDTAAVDFLERLRVPAYKVASFEITDIPLIEYAASKGKPMLISTGVALPGDIKEALAACRKYGNHNVALLKCTSSYPAPFSEMNLRTIPDMAARYNCVTGLSDHSTGFSAPVAAAALGARIVEKHFILDRGLGGPDAAFSLEPAEFSQMASAVREVEASLGRATYTLSARSKVSRRFARSLFAVKDIAKGEEITASNVASVRPADGLPPKVLPLVLGKTAMRNIEAGTPMKWSLIG